MYIVDDIVVGIGVILDQFLVETSLVLVLDFKRDHFLDYWIQQGVGVGRLGLVVDRKQFIGLLLQKL